MHASLETLWLCLLLTNSTILILAFDIAFNIKIDVAPPFSAALSFTSLVFIAACAVGSKVIRSKVEPFVKGAIISSALFLGVTNLLMMLSSIDLISEGVESKLYIALSFINAVQALAFGALIAIR